jgi:hypothetical protein
MNPLMLQGTVSVYATVAEVAEREGPLSSEGRGKYLCSEILKLIKVPMPPA